MAMSTAYLNATADAGAALITHLGLVDATATELSGGTYARLPVTWTAAVDGLVRPTADKAFNVPAGASVAGWRGFSALTAGTNYGGEAVTQENYANAGTYTLLAASTSIDHNAV